MSRYYLTPALHFRSRSLTGRLCLFGTTNIPIIFRFSKQNFVELSGLEPELWEPKSQVLPLHHNSKFPGFPVPGTGFRIVFRTPRRLRVQHLEPPRTNRRTSRQYLSRGGEHLRHFRFWPQQMVGGGSGPAQAWTVDLQIMSLLL